MGDAMGGQEGEAARTHLGASLCNWDAHSDTYRELAMLLGVAVPLWITRLLNRDGPRTEDFTRIAGYSDELGSADAVLCGSKQPGAIASFFNKLAEAMAVLSFCPGGIELFGLHYESAPLLSAWQTRTGASPEYAAPSEGDD